MGKPNTNLVTSSETASLQRAALTEVGQPYTERSRLNGAVLSGLEHVALSATVRSQSEGHAFHHNMIDSDAESTAHTPLPDRGDYISSAYTTTR